MGPTVDDARDRARGFWDAADFDASLNAALEGLDSAPDDVELLVLAGRAGVEVDADDAVEHLRRATELAPDNAGAWHHLGEALAAEGATEEAETAFRRAVELDPDDQLAITHLGHTALAAGRRDEGVGYLARAADIAHAASSASISLVDMYRSMGQYEDALTQARRVAEATPEDTIAWLDVAELSLQTGQLDEARAAFERLRELDEIPGHEAYPLHGMIQVEVARERWEPAGDLVDQAAAIDPLGLSIVLAAFLREQTGEPAEGDTDESAPAPTRDEVDAVLAGSLGDYRRMLADDRLLRGGDLVG
ncbi:MAG TPA: tetratricopeptide repeat protein [Solirubrobacteraceae bacterium]|nr:tetratricopeptide repeat protein [Solirubrobacteraceae bacterium]